MSENQYDLFVIGAGSGGVRAARMAAGLGAKVAIAEDRYLGGTCVNAGCVPKKLFVYASHLAEDLDIARSFGWSVDDAQFNWPTLIKNKDAEIKRLNNVYQKILDDNGVNTITGRAILIDNHTVSINEAKFTADRILVSTGGWPSVPDIPGKEYVITSNEAFHLEHLPERIMIVGGGYIAVEFAGIFNGLGVDTTLLYRGPLFLRGFDQDLRKVLAEEMHKKNINLEFNCNIGRIEKNKNELTAHLANNNEQKTTDLIMYATGRRPNTANMGLENTDVKLDDKDAIIVNDDYQSSDHAIFAIGDVTNRVNLTPVAVAEGMALATSLFGDKTNSVNYENIPTCIFSQPNLGTVGLTEEVAREKYDDIEIYKSHFKPMKLSLSDSNEKTFMKLVVDKKTEQVVGIHMIGPDAGEIIQGMAIAMQTGATKTIFNSTIGIHPTAAEEFVTMREPVKD